MVRKKYINKTEILFSLQARAKAFKVDKNLFSDLGLEKACKAISAVCLQKFVYITWSHDQFCLQKP